MNAYFNIQRDELAKSLRPNTGGVRAALLNIYMSVCVLCIHYLFFGTVSLGICNFDVIFLLFYFVEDLSLRDLLCKIFCLILFMVEKKMIGKYNNEN